MGGQPKAGLVLDLFKVSSGCSRVQFQVTEGMHAPTRGTRRAHSRSCGRGMGSHRGLQLGYKISLGWVGYQEESQKD